MDVKTARIIQVVGSTVRVQFAGDAQPSVLAYAMLQGFDPVVGDTALMLKTSTSYVCIGVIKH